MNDQQIINQIKSEFASALKFDQQQMDMVFSSRYNILKTEEDTSLNSKDADMQTAGWFHGNPIASKIKQKKLMGKKGSFHKDRAKVIATLRENFGESSDISDTGINNLAIGYIKAMNESEENLKHRIR